MLNTNYKMYSYPLIHKSEIEVKQIETFSKEDHDEKSGSEGLNQRKTLIEGNIQGLNQHDTFVIIGQFSWFKLNKKTKTIPERSRQMDQNMLTFTLLTLLICTTLQVYEKPVRMRSPNTYQYLLLTTKYQYLGILS